MKVIGITGTDGKTTTSHLIYHILKSEGLKVALISTVAAKIGDKEYDTGFHVTTPDSFQIQKYLSLAKKAKCDYVVLEVTSHALHQNRVFGIHFDVGVMTNVSHEHMDYHKSYEKYVETKYRLLALSDTVVVNKDDRSYNYLLAFKGQWSKQLWKTYGFKNADVTLQTAPFVKELQGEYNWSNALAATAVGELLGVSVNEVEKAVKTFTLPKGRFDKVYDKEFSIYIDFAHTPNSLEQVLKTLKGITKGRLIHIFGSAGMRDASKRPLMGKASSMYSDVIILTAEDPRSESIETICEEIKSGVSRRDAVVIIPDRQDAITAGVEMAKKGDVIIITGKGHERSMNLGDGEVPWSDYEGVKTALKKL